jgi:DNA-binding response OmpR family regulator
MDSVHLRDRHFASDRSVDMLIARLRAKTQSFGLQIKAIRGAGYMLCSPVERLA